MTSPRGAGLQALVLLPLALLTVAAAIALWP